MVEQSQLQAAMSSRSESSQLEVDFGQTLLPKDPSA